LSYGFDVLNKESVLKGTFDRRFIVNVIVAVFVYIVSSNIEQNKNHFYERSGLRQM
jgi:hypothetical protein